MSEKPESVKRGVWHIAWCATVLNKTVTLSFSSHEDADRAFDGLVDGQVISALINPENDQ